MLIISEFRMNHNSKKKSKNHIILKSLSTTFKNYQLSYDHVKTK